MFYYVLVVWKHVCALLCSQELRVMLGKDIFAANLNWKKKMIAIKNLLIRHLIFNNFMASNSSCSYNYFNVLLFYQTYKCCHANNYEDFEWILWRENLFPAVVLLCIKHLYLVQQNNKEQSSTLRRK